MLEVILSLLILILILGILVFVHELGHFAVAKLNGVEVVEFAFGFGPRLFSFEYKETVYRVNAIFLGGYVKMLGDEDPSSFNRKASAKFTPDYIKEKKAVLSKMGALDGSIINILKVLKTDEGLSEEERQELLGFVNGYVIPNDPDNLENKSYFQKIAVFTAGVIMNFIVAVFIFLLYFSINNFQTDFAYITNYPFIGTQEEIYHRPLVTKVYSRELIEQGFETSEDNPIISIFEIDGQIIKNTQDFNRIWPTIEGKSVEVAYVNYSDNNLTRKNMILNTTAVDINIEPNLQDRVIFSGKVEDGFPAQKADIQRQDILLSINGEDLKFPETEDFIEYLSGKENQSLDFEVFTKDGEVVLKKVELGEKEGDILLGAGFDINGVITIDQYHLDYSGNKAFSGFAHAVNVLGYNVVALGEIFSLSLEEKDPGLAAESISSIWGIGEQINTLVVARDFKSIVHLSGLISVGLAFMNILPIPLLDGGQVMFVTIERLLGRPISARIKQRVGEIAFFALIALSILIILKDIWAGFVGEFVRGVF